jgi:hypothetical protein
VTKTAHVDIAADTAAGHDPVTGHGPSGDITAQGFQILDRGDTVVFTGTSYLLLKGAKPSAHPAAGPQTLPVEITETAAALEAAATTPEPMAPEASVPKGPTDHAAATARALTPDPDARPDNPRKPEAKRPPGRAPAAIRPKHDAN